MRCVVSSHLVRVLVLDPQRLDLWGGGHTGEVYWNRSADCACSCCLGHSFVRRHAFTRLALARIVSVVSLVRMRLSPDDHPSACRDWENGSAVGPSVSSCGVEMGVSKCFERLLDRKSFDGGPRRREGGMGRVVLLSLPVRMVLIVVLRTGDGTNGGSDATVGRSRRV